ncbi:dihydroorotase [Lawsonia intracellularis]|uniref:Dihydroorotase n=1 Tax=Lawsonia intracellularis (strain PHE/MN1-00) TaxID=363253 RepID=Q1MQ54_LAWIP|nr:dihydroorotase [Lawsonia intracellularis]AGC50244.1 dihydroorotase [Lawsonia intracellularis N343]KAA0204265.1 dihydroorotase [Lawsonia intracellularis]MBZ3892685.1 dihydroorotase [Lawsonia intracellularis]OMQ03044.1 dihydroorotase [Lawsonia intracellularis]RBN33148.1 dihydroorotase [Lawsonia intracellularis]
MSSLFLYNAYYDGKLVSLEVRDGKIITLKEGEQNSTSSPIDLHPVDAKQKHLFPSFIDVHTHLREPGYEWKETIATGLAAAAHGGFGSVLCMANTNPVNDSATVTCKILESGKYAFPNGPYVYPIGAATIGLKGEQLSPMHELAEAGCIAISNDGLPIKNTELFRRILEYASDLGLIVIDHCEDPYLACDTHMNEGFISGKLGLSGQPDIAETLQAIRSILLAEYLNVPVHIAHVSAKRTVEAISWGKSRGVKVTAETCPHYLLLDERAVIGYNTNAKVNPPLRTQEDIMALREAIKTGIIDMLATDHAPHAAYEKEVPFDKAPNGFTGFDVAIPVMYSLVREGVLSESDLIRLWSNNPAGVFNLPINNFKPGDPANFFLFDPELEWTVSKENLYSKSWNTPWLGETLKGRVVMHWINGVKVV